MARWTTLLDSIRAIVGCAPRPDGRAIEQSIRPLTGDEQSRLAETREIGIAELRKHYAIPADADDLGLLQRVVDTGDFLQTTNLWSLGVAWGDLICRETGAVWVTAEWEGQRMPAIKVPETAILMFPSAMLEKRRDRGERVDFPLFLGNIICEIEQMKRNPEYRR